MQPWRFLYAKRENENWARLLDLLIPFNRSWAQSASLLIFVLSDAVAPGKAEGELVPSQSHSFDAGAAWALLALRGIRMGYHSHGMTGVDFDRPRTELAIPDRYRIEAAVAAGRIGDKSTLPEGLQAREAPSSRKPVGEFAFAARFRPDPADRVSAPSSIWAAYTAAALENGRLSLP